MNIVESMFPSVFIATMAQMFPSVLIATLLQAHGAHNVCETVTNEQYTKQCVNVEQRAPPIFCRAAITLGIGPHSSL